MANTRVQEKAAAVSSSTAPAVTLDATATNGKYLVAALAYRDPANAADAAITIPTDFNLVVDNPGAGNYGLVVAYKKSVGTEDIITWGSDIAIRASMYVGEFNGLDATTFLDDSGEADTNADTTIDITHGTLSAITNANGLQLTFASGKGPAGALSTYDHTPDYTGYQDTSAGSAEVALTWSTKLDAGPVATEDVAETANTSLRYASVHLVANTSAVAEAYELTVSGDGNTFDGRSVGGVDVTGSSSGWHITGDTNTVKGHRFHDLPLNGVRLAGTGALFQGDIFDSCTGDGLIIEAGATGAVIENCTFYGCNLVLEESATVNNCLFFGGGITIASGKTLSGAKNRGDTAPSGLGTDSSTGGVWIDSDPFIDAAGADFRIALGSYAGVGYGTAVSGYATDFDGTTLESTSAPDIGAQEYIAPVTATGIGLVVTLGMDNAVVNTPMAGSGLRSRLRICRV